MAQAKRVLPALGALGPSRRVCNYSTFLVQTSAFPLLRASSSWVTVPPTTGSETPTKLQPQIGKTAVTGPAARPPLSMAKYKRVTKEKGANWDEEMSCATFLCPKAQGTHGPCVPCVMGQGVPAMGRGWGIQNGGRWGLNGRGQPKYGKQGERGPWHVGLLAENE